MSTRKILTTMSFAALFAGAAMATEPIITLESIENEESFDVASGKYVQVSGAYYHEGGLPDGKLHKGPVVNVGSMSIDGTFEVKASDQNANRLFDVENVSGKGEIRFGRGVYISQESDFSNFDGTLTLFTAVNEQGNRKGAGAYFLSGTNNPSNINAFNLEENTELSFTNGDYTLNGKIEGAGTISARTRENLNFEGDKILENAAPANVVIKSDISNFSGSYAAGESSSIKLETKLADNVVFVGWTGGTLELAGAAGDARKTITIDSSSDTTTSGNVFMYGNKAIIANNSRAGGKVDANCGYIYFGGNNEYSATEKISHTFDSTTVLENTAGNVAIGGSGKGSSMEDGADIVVDGVKMYSLTGGGADGARVKGDISLTVKSGEVENLVGGGRGGVHVGNTSITVENGSVSNIYGGDQFGGKVEGDINISVKGGKVGTIYGSNYSSNTPNAEIFNGVSGDVTIDISGGEVNHIRGGINSNNAGDVAIAKQKMVLNGDVVINVGGDAHIGAYDGESILATGGSYASVNGTTTVNISDNAVVEGIIAGGASRTYESGVKSSNINISGGTLNGDVYAGGLKYSSVSGNTAVNISGGEINADVYGGGAVGTSVKGNSTISLTGSAAVINGTLYGGGLNGGTVEGVKTLNLGTSEQAYKGTSALKIADFDTINVAKGTTASVEKIEQNLTGAVAGSRTFVNEGANFTVEGDIVNTLENATNNGSFVAGLTSVEGDLQSGGSAIVKGTVKTVINGADTKLKYFYGGNGGNQKGSDPNFRAIMVSSVDAVDVTVNDGSIDMIVGNGAMLSDVNGNVGITVNGGTIGGIYGAGSNGLIGGDVNITVNGGTFKGDQSGAYTIAIAAGGANNANDSIDVSTISGSTNVVIGGDAKLNGDVFGGGWGGYTGKKQGGVIEGGTNITLKDNATILGTIYGGGIAGNTVIKDKKTLNIGTADAAYNGASALKVADFQKINIVNGSAEFASYTQAAEGTLITVSEKGKLAMSLNSESQFSNTSVENGGSLVLKRGELADSAAVSFKDYTGSGKVSAFGGTFADGVFTAGKSEFFVSSPITVGTGENDVQTVKLGDKLTLDFDVAGLGEAALSVNEIKASTDLDGIKGDVLAAYDVDLNDNSNDYTVVFSAYVGEIEAADALLAWHKGKDGVWTRLDTSIDYADKIASIVVDGFSSYAFSQVPEPATYAAIFGALALAFAAYRRRK